MTSKTIRQVHRPGDLVPMRVTAEAWRHICNALAKAAADHKRQSRRGVRRRVPEAASVNSTIAENYEQLKGEIMEGFNTIPSREIARMDDAYVGPLVGECLMRGRRAAFAEDKAELARREGRTI